MKSLVISKPIFSHILPLNEFPSDGDKFFIDSGIKTLASLGSTIAILLSRYGINTSYTGVVGNDETGNKVRDILVKNKVDTSVMELSENESTPINYQIYNAKTNTFTNVLEKSLKRTLTKYKYDFNPDVVIMDDGDYEANMAAINNYPNANLFYIGLKYNATSSVYANKCRYVISTLSFASDITGVVNGLNKPKNIVNLFQKYVDLYNSNLIIVMDNFDVLYYVNDEVRLIKNTNTIKNKDNIYYALLIYFIINTNNIEESIKFTNKAMELSKSELDQLQNIPDYKDIYPLIQDISKYKISGLKPDEKIEEVKLTNINEEKPIEIQKNDNNDVELPKENEMGNNNEQL